MSEAVRDAGCIRERKRDKLPAWREDVGEKAIKVDTVFEPLVCKSRLEALLS